MANNFTVLGNVTLYFVIFFLLGKVSIFQLLQTSIFLQWDFLPINDKLLFWIFHLEFYVLPLVFYLYFSYHVEIYILILNIIVQNYSQSLLCIHLLLITIIYGIIDNKLGAGIWFFCLFTRLLCFVRLFNIAEPQFSHL